MEKGGLSRSLRRAGVRPGTLIGFADEMRVGLRGMVRRVWGVRGLKVVQSLQLVYEWKYLFLVVDFVRGKLEWAWMDSMKSETVVRAVLGMRRYTQVRALVWDGARSHRSELVRSVAGVKTIVQPHTALNSIQPSECSRRYAGGWRAGCTRVLKRKRLLWMSV